MTYGKNLSGALDAGVMDEVTFKVRLSSLLDMEDLEPLEALVLLEGELPFLVEEETGVPVEDIRAEFWFTGDSDEVEIRASFLREADDSDYDALEELIWEARA